MDHHVKKAKQAELQIAICKYAQQLFMRSYPKLKNKTRTNLKVQIEQAISAAELFYEVWQKRRKRKSV